MKRKTILLVMLCALTLFSLPVSVSGAESSPPQMQAASLTSASVPVVQGAIVISEVDGLERAPAVAYNPTANEYLVVWQMENAPSVFGVYAQRVGPDGELITPTPIEVAANVGVLHGGPTVAYDPVYQRYLVAYPNLNSDIYGRFVNSDGTTPQPSFAIASSSDKHESPEAAYGKTGGNFMVTWQIGTSTGTGIAAQVIPGDGSAINAAIWTTVAFDANPEKRQNPDIAYNETHNEFDIVYQKYDTVNGDNDIFGSRLNPDGTVVADCDGYGAPIESECGIWAFAPEETEPSIAHCASVDRTVILWQNDGDIIGQMSSGANMAYYNYITLSNNGFVDEKYPEAACNLEGTEFMATWQEWDASIGKSNYARSIDLSGNTGTAVDIKAPATTYSYANGGASGLAGGRTSYFITWEQERIGLGYGDIYARFIVPHVVFMPMALK